MADFPKGIDPEAAGSRFTSRVGIALLSRPHGESRFDERGDTGDPADVASEVLADVATDKLGDPDVMQGSYGRGAASWVPIVEWAAATVGIGVLQGAAWDGVKLAARQLRSMVDRLRERGVRFAISRGGAARLAIDHVADTAGETGILDVEAVEEPSAIAGRPVTEVSYVAFEPWLVSIVNERRTRRYIIAVSPEGEVLGSMSFPMSELELPFGVLPPRT